MTVQDHLPSSGRDNVQVVCRVLTETSANSDTFELASFPTQVWEVMGFLCMGYLYMLSIGPITLLSVSSSVIYLCISIITRSVPRSLAVGSLGLGVR